MKRISNWKGYRFRFLMGISEIFQDFGQILQILSDRIYPLKGQLMLCDDVFTPILGFFVLM